MELSFGKHKIAVAVAIVLATAAALLFFDRTALAEIAWNRFRAPQMALIFDVSDASLALNIGIYAFGVGSYDPLLAQQAFQKAVAIDGGILWGHYQLARVLFVEGKLREADVEINKELVYHPDNLRALYVRGLIHAYSKDLPGAALDFEHFTEWAPSEWAGYNDLAWILGQEGKYKEAKAALERGLHMAVGAGENPWLWNNLGVQELNLGDYSGAIKSFENAQTFAAPLNEDSWKLAYPGNDPSGNNERIKAFQNAITANLARARIGS